MGFITILTLDFDLKRKNMVWYRSDKKRTTNDLLCLSVSWLKKHNYLRENATINGGLTWKRTFGNGYSKEIGSVIYSANFIEDK